MRTQFLTLFHRCKSPLFTSSQRMVQRMPGADDMKNPIDVMKKDFKDFSKARKDSDFFPAQSDFVVIGGGVMGCSVAYWLKQRNPTGVSVTVIERDMKYTRASTVLSVGGLRQQFSLPENIQMSMFGAEFLRDIKKHLSIYDEDPPDVQFHPLGYLLLASEKGVEQLKSNYKIQREYGAMVEFLSASQLKSKFPWLNIEGLEAGVYGYQNEGWLDPWSLLIAFRNKAKSLGTRFIEGDVVDFETDERHVIDAEGFKRNKNLRSILVKVGEELRPIRFAYCINAAGPWAGEIAEKAGVGTGSAELNLHVPLPVEPRKRYVYVMHSPDGPGLNTPLTVNPDGCYFRREGIAGHYVAGLSPTEEEEPPIDNLEVDYSFFNEKIWPSIAHRVPAFNKIKVKNAWGGYYDYNYKDQNGIIGRHPYFRNLIFINGFSGHGLQQAPAAGRAVMEYLLDDGFRTIDLSRFSFDRFITNKLVYESNIV